MSKFREFFFRFYGEQGYVNAMKMRDIIVERGYNVESFMCSPITMSVNMMVPPGSKELSVKFISPEERTRFVSDADCKKLYLELACPAGGDLVVRKPGDASFKVA
jgi:hypothetical protein